jgi:hypothetical protein
MLLLFAIGIVVGLEHALEADHVIAVTTLTSRTRSTGRAVRLAVAWGLGHTVTLVLVGLLVLVLKLTIPPSLALFFEFVVGLLLITLGVNVLRQLFQGRVHVHEHEHDEVSHVHVHQHAQAHAEHGGDHHHRHSFLIGIVHGLAGSAALVLLVPASGIGLLPSLGFILFFGFGSVIGMALITVLISAPFKLTANFDRLNHSIQAVAGTGSIVMGLVIAYTTASAL